MKIIETIRSNMIQNILSMILGVLSYLILSVYSDILPSILPMLQGLPNTILIKISIAAIILFALSLALTIVVYLHYKPSLTPRFGVLWDKNKEPHCPSCKTYLSGYTELPKAFYFICHGHEKRKEVYLHNDGVPISLSDARKLI